MVIRSIIKLNLLLLYFIPFSAFYHFFRVLSLFPRFILFSAFYPFFRVLSLFPRFIPFSAFYPFFRVLSLFPRFIPFSAFYPFFRVLSFFPLPEFRNSVIPDPRFIPTRLCGRFTRLRVDGKRNRENIYPVLNLHGYVWTGPVTVPRRV